MTKPGREATRRRKDREIKRFVTLGTLAGILEDKEQADAKKRTLVEKMKAKECK